MDQYDYRQGGDYQGTKHMAKEYVGGKVSAKVSKGQVKSSGKDYFPDKPHKSVLADVGEASKFDYPDTADSIQDKQKMNKSKIDKNSQQQWFVT